ncbi:MAG: hypothetical protein WD906_03515 [Anaerolineales bacterium]
MAPKKKARAKQTSATGSGARVRVENVNVPGRTTWLDKDMYAAMRRALLKALPARAPGLTQTEIRRAVVRHLPQSLYARGAKAAWWAKAVQLDLEAKGIVGREASQPLRWHRKGSKK